MKAPEGRISGDVLTRPADTEGIRGELPQNLVVLRKIYFKHMIKTKIFPSKKMFLAPNPGHRPVSAKIVSAIRIFCFEGHSASRCSITSTAFFHKSPSGGPWK